MGAAIPENVRFFEGIRAQTPCLQIQQANLEGVKPDEEKWHAGKELAQLLASAVCTALGALQALARTSTVGLRQSTAQP